MRIHTGILGQIGDIVAFTPTARRLKALYPDARLTFAVSERYREAGELVAGLPYVDRVFVTRLYFERLTPELLPAWEAGRPVDLRGSDEVVEEAAHDVVLPTRPRHRRNRWWEHAHLTEELAHMVGVAGPIDPRTEVLVPEGTPVPEAARGRIVLHNDPALDPAKAWPWEHVRALAETLGPGEVVVLGSPGPPLPGVLDLRGRTTLVQAAAVIAGCRAFVGIDSGLMWIAGSLRVPAVGIYGTAHLPRPEAVQPVNSNATYLRAEGAPGRVLPERVVRALRERVE